MSIDAVSDFVRYGPVSAIRRRFVALFVDGRTPHAIHELLRDHECMNDPCQLAVDIRQ